MVMIPKRRLLTLIFACLCFKKSLLINNNNNNNKPETVVENEQATILGNMPIHTDREIRANKPDIIIRDHTNQRCWIIDMAVPLDRNASAKVVEEFSKHKDLEIEIARMWKMETETIPVVIGALGVIKKGLEKCVDKISGSIYKSTSSKKNLLFREQLTSSERFCQSSELLSTYIRAMVSPRCFRD